MIMDLILTTEEQITLEEEMALWEQMHINELFSEWSQLEMPAA